MFYILSNIKQKFPKLKIYYFGNALIKFLHIFPRDNI